MQAQAAGGVPFLLTVGFCIGAWLSGAIFGWGLRETGAFFARGRSARVGIRETRTQGEAPLRRRRRVRHAGRDYFVSEDTQRWSDRRWVRWVGWASVVTLIVLVTGTTYFAARTYASDAPSSPAEAR